MYNDVYFEIVHFFYMKSQNKALHVEKFLKLLFMLYFRIIKTVRIIVMKNGSDIWVQIRSYSYNRMVMSVLCDRYAVTGSLMRSRVRSPSSL